MEFEIDSLLGMEIDCAKKIIESYDIHKNLIIRELVSLKYKGDRKNDVCRIVLAKISKEDIVLTVSYF
jgi:hypothetical protein